MTTLVPRARGATSARRALAALAALALAGGGCSSSRTARVTGPPGDNGGVNLVAFVSDRGNAAGVYDIVLYDLDENGYRSVVNLNGPERESEPCLSDDGNFIAMAGDRGSAGSGGQDVWVYDRLTQVFISTPGLNSAHDERWPRFTHDSNKLAFVYVSSDTSAVRLYDPTQRGLVALPGLAAAGAHDDEPAPNLDGTRIAFISDRTGRNELWTWISGGGASRPAGLAGDSTDAEPSLSSDARWLAFASNRSGGAGGWDVYLYDQVADSLVALPGLNSPMSDRHPSVSNDGGTIVFESDRAGGGGGHDLYLYTLATHTLSQPAGFRNASDDLEPFLRVP